MIEDSVLAGLYTRLSHDPGNDRLGVQRQERECREVCARHGLDPVVFEDDDLSAYKPGRRPAYERMLADLEDGRLTAVVCWHTDRLYRHPHDLERLVEIAEKRGIPVYTVAGGDLNLSTASGRMLARMLGAASRHEVERTAERIKAKHRELAMAGRRAGGGARPYGYDDDHETIRPEEAERIREGARRVLAGESLNAVCRDWIARGVPGPTGGRWWPSALRAILIAARISGRREVYGKEGPSRRLGKITATAVWPGIIDVDTSDRLRAMLSAEGRLTTRWARSHLLTGIAVCGACGTPLEAHGTSAEGKRRIGCKRGPGSGGCSRVSTLAEPLEELVTAAVLSAVDAGALAALARNSEDPEAAEELAAAQAKLVQLGIDYDDDRITRTEYEERRPRLAEREKAARRRVEAARRSIGLEGLPDPLRAAWTATKPDGTPVLPLASKRAVVRALVESVTVAPAAVRGRHVFDTERVTITWKA